MDVSGKVVMERIGNDEYRAENDSLSMRREYGLTPQGNPMSGRWVVRDAAGVMLDFDQYANDLAERRCLKLF